MAVTGALRKSLGLLVPLAIACTVYLYLFPFFSGCAFPLPSRDSDEAFEQTKGLHWPYAQPDQQANATTKLAPFRLLTIGDPQLEGDTSIPVKVYGFFPHVKEIYKRVTFQTWHSTLRDRLRMILHDLVDLYFEDIPNLIESGRKVFDLFGNDFYLAHIYRTVHWWTKPTHVTVLGDLLGSQWIDDNEFEQRGDRFWNRAFKGGQRLPDEIAQWPNREYNISGRLDGSPEQDVWINRILNVAGNHDIGYAGDLTEERMERFQRVFGKANYELRFELPITDPKYTSTVYDSEKNPDALRIAPEIRIIVINDMNLDTPAKSKPLQDQTYEFINAVITSSHAVEFEGHFTLVLTHIPMYKPAGVCVDAPFFDFHSDGDGIKEQYLLSEDASKGFWEGIFGVSGNPMAAGKGRGRPGLILNGHDHEGCDTYHYINQTNGTSAKDRSWEIKRWHEAKKLNIVGQEGIPGRRELTVRSMMGDFGGNTGLLSMWFNPETWEWEYEFAQCPLGRQHLWWFVHILDFGVVFLILVYGLVSILQAAGVDVDGNLGSFSRWLSSVVSELAYGEPSSAAPNSKLKGKL
ncbi:unnamed protein product [Clonostachys rhizophaga]|uniref:Protein TED1 n=1 Tax=Clonostachys rhizophaga TaxID=160324 RepID=A0A9N9VQJ7_9HYPO|nr:unnamed protein product [Clonostachys rhizophaga]